MGPMEKALRLACADYLESEGKPREGEGLELTVQQYKDDAGFVGATDTYWRTGLPTSNGGYYLVAWRRCADPTPEQAKHPHPTPVVVSELWFNPDANPKWWWSRGYAPVRQPRWPDSAMNHEVIAWMPMPEPPLT